jgi:two-component system sensor histidine kinase QseC
LGQRWRTYRWQDTQHQRDIMIAQPLAERIAMAEAMAQSSLLPLIISTPVLALLIALTLTKGLSPLKSLSKNLQRREADDLSAIELAHCPAELQPVVATINHLFNKVELAFAREKRFSSDAAHELRTPLSVLQVNIHNLMQQAPTLQQLLQELNQSVQRMSHVIEQILLLNRTHPDHYQKTFASLAVNELCQQAISDCYSAIVDRKQTIALEADAVSLIGDAFALNTLLQNLITNASKYTPNHGEILLRVWQQNDTITLCIEDSGPGIAEPEQSRVLDRFYRIGGDQHHSSIIGCGLGMAIVKQIVDLHHGSISLSRSHRLGGLAVAVTLPRNPAGLC